MERESCKRKRAEVNGFEEGTPQPRNQPHRKKSRREQRRSLSGLGRKQCPSQSGSRCVQRRSRSIRRRTRSRSRSGSRRVQHRSHSGSRRAQRSSRSDSRRTQRRSRSIRRHTRRRSLSGSRSVQRRSHSGSRRAQRSSQSGSRRMQRRSRSIRRRTRSRSRSGSRRVQHRSHSGSRRAQRSSRSDSRRTQRRSRSIRRHTRRRSLSGSRSVQRRSHSGSRRAQRSSRSGSRRVHRRSRSISSRRNRHSNVGIQSQANMGTRLHSISTSRTMAAMSLGFIVMVTPATIQEVVAACTGCKVPASIDFIVTWLALSNSFWNPFLYWLLNSHFRRISNDLAQFYVCCKRKDPLAGFEKTKGCCGSSTPSDAPPQLKGEIEGLGEKYWGEILERTVSSSSLHALQKACHRDHLRWNGSLKNCSVKPACKYDPRYFDCAQEYNHFDRGSAFRIDVCEQPCRNKNSDLCLFRPPTLQYERSRSNLSLDENNFSKCNGHLPDL